MSVESLFTFILASSLISLAPGPDNIFVLTQSALYGKKSGLLVTLGLCTGLMVHTLAVALGVAAIFQTSPLAFDLLKYLGAAYLIYLAWQAFNASSSQRVNNRGNKLSYRALYVRGIIMNISNPKVSLFFLAFLPQFTQPSSGSVFQQFMLLGGIFIGVALIVFGLIAYMASYLGNWINHSPKGQIYLNRVAGAVFLGLAAKLIVSNATM